ncbi:hypothetical protein HMPREF9087_1298 [Enterococcus casseliflavus ATCC 12755]|uniref:Uncharacterized protein n=1 Tax=Enterococcus casseliflavus ATCC 12755 TaxID=888066 RepID=F0EIL0_ENTCA|nr:hypothetical protein HMPREF9087_1298 [Enterococcus casseliflavus ATCC 12755]
MQIKIIFIFLFTKNIFLYNKGVEWRRYHKGELIGLGKWRMCLKLKEQSDLGEGATLQDQ